jgi:hypothetical protein
VAGARSWGVSPVYEWSLLTASQRQGVVGETIKRLGWFRDEIPAEVFQQLQRDDVFQYFEGARWIENDRVRRKIDEIAARTHLRFLRPGRPLDYRPDPVPVGAPPTPNLRPRWLRSPLRRSPSVHTDGPREPPEEPPDDGESDLPEPDAWDESVPDPLSIPSPEEELVPATVPEEESQDDPFAQLDRMEEELAGVGPDAPTFEPPSSIEPEAPTGLDPGAALEERSDPGIPTGPEPPEPLTEDPEDAPDGTSVSEDPDDEPLPSLKEEPEEIAAAVPSPDPVEVATVSEELLAANAGEEEPFADGEDPGDYTVPTPEDIAHQSEPVVQVVNPTVAELRTIPDTVWVSIFFGGILLMGLELWNLLDIFGPSTPQLPLVSMAWLMPGIFLMLIGVGIFAITSVGTSVSPSNGALVPKRPVTVTVRVE